MRRPWISTNLAISADGKISPVARRASGWTSKADHLRLLELRRGAGALMVGHGTLKSDRMTMTVPDQPWQPLRCIVTRDGGIDPDHPVFSKSGGPIHVLCTENRPTRPSYPAFIHHGPLEGFLETLHVEHGIESLHCEGGGMLIHELAIMDAIDEFHLTLAGHTLFGGRESVSPTGMPGSHLPEARRFELQSFRSLNGEGECFLTYVRKRSNQ